MHCFQFLEIGDGSAAIRREITEFFDGGDWKDVLSSVANDKIGARDSTIAGFVAKIKNRVIPGIYVFQTHKPRYLAELMRDYIDREFLTIALNLNDAGAIDVIPFIETLVKLVPDDFIDKVTEIEMSDGVKRNLVRLMISVYACHEFAAIKRYLLMVPLQLFVEEMRKHVEGGGLKTSSVEMLMTRVRESGFLEVVHREMVVSVERKEEKFVDVVLELLKEMSDVDVHIYSGSFSAVCAECYGKFLVDVLVNRAMEESCVIIEMQCECLGEQIAAPLRDVLRKRTLSADVFSDVQILRMSAEYKRMREIPRIIMQKFMFERRLIVDFVGPRLWHLGETDAQVKRLAEEMYRQKMIHRSPFIESSLCDGQVRGQRFTDMKINARDIINSFHVGLFSNTSDITGFVDVFEKEVLQRMSFVVREQFAASVMDFLCSNLSEQHRRSLSILALRCQISAFVHKILKCPQSREVEVLTGLHCAAITSAVFLELIGRRSKPKKSKSGTLEFVSSNETVRNGVAIIDSVVIQRLRWRVLRRDCDVKICWLPEFLQLCGVDLELFLQWECGVKDPVLRHGVLSELGITTASSLFPRFLFELLRCNPPDAVSNVMIPLFSTIPMDKIIIPEKPNLRILYKTDILWSRAVMLHPAVIADLQDPLPETSQALLSALPLNGDIDFIFSEFPHGMAAMLLHFHTLSSQKPRVLCEAHIAVNGKHKHYESFQRYAVASIAAVVSRQKGNLVELARYLATPEAQLLCLFFAVCCAMFDSAIDLLNGFPSLIPLLRQGVPEEAVFFGAGFWSDSLVKFAVYCSRRDCSFSDSVAWRQFVDCVKVSNWPDRLTIDNDSLCSLARYDK